MKPSSKKYIFFGAVASVAICCILYVQAGRRIVHTFAFPNPSFNDDGGFVISVESTEKLARAWTLWKLRKQRDIVPDLLPLLNDDSFQVRQFAVRALSKLESPLAEKPIADLLGKQAREAQVYKASIVKLHTQPDAERPKVSIPLPLLMLQLAIARIQSRELEGQQRLTYIAKSAGFSWPELVAASKEVNGKNRWFGGRGSTADTVIEEIVDVIHTLGKRGETTSGLAEDLTLIPEQSLRLQGASVSDEQEAKLIINYADSVKAVTGDSYPLADWLYEIGSPAVQPLLKHFQGMRVELKQNPQKYAQSRGYVILFRAATLLREKRAIPMLKEFVKVPERWMPSKAAHSYVSIEISLKNKTRQFPPGSF